MYKIFTSWEKRVDLNQTLLMCTAILKLPWNFNQESHGHYDIQITITTFSSYFAICSNMHSLFSHFRQKCHGWSNQFQPLLFFRLFLNLGHGINEDKGSDKGESCGRTFPQCSQFYSRELPTIRLVNVCRPSKTALPSPNRWRSCLLETRYVGVLEIVFN